VYEEIRRQMGAALTEFLETARLREGDLLVVGCSSSEVMGGQIGHASSFEAAQALYEEIAGILVPRGIFLAAQCCEHLNRALILEEAAVRRYGYEPVNAVPQPKAGGSFATAAYRAMEHPCTVEHIRAHAGLDIGDTFIGMHLREVAVPVRISLDHIGEAHLTCARTRAKFIGGERAHYDPALQ
jgi:uncharacterized protein (TIGR01440 family)